MKPLHRILFLSTIVALIVVLWLMPKINTAKDIRYTRIYENTDPKSSVKDNPAKVKKNADTTSRADQKKVTVAEEKDHVIEKVKTQEENKALNKKTPKEYSKESIESNYKLKNVNAKMYSRAIHFMPEDWPVVKDSVVKDSIVQ